jgi:Flp pilus assembly protein TadD
VQVGSQARADRYTYLPLIGLSILPVWSLAELAERRRAWRAPVAVASAAALATLAVAAHRQVGIWRDGISLFSHTLAATRENPLAHAYLGEALMLAGRPAEAAEQLRASLHLKPDFVKVMNNLAWLLATNPEVPPADPGEPLRLARSAVRASGGRQPQFLYTLAVALAQQGRLLEAERTARRAASLARMLGAEPLALEILARAAAFRRERLE